MQVITKVYVGHLDVPTPVTTTKAVPTTLDKKLKQSVDSFKSFVEAPFHAEVVQIETIEDII